MLTSPSGTRLTWNAGVTGRGGSCDPTTDSHWFVRTVTPLAGVPQAYVVDVYYKSSSERPYLAIIGGIPAPGNGTTMRTPTVGDSGNCYPVTTFDSKNFNSETGQYLLELTSDAPTAADADTVKVVLQSVSY